MQSVSCAHRFDPAPETSLHPRATQARCISRRQSASVLHWLEPSPASRAQRCERQTVREAAQSPSFAQRSRPGPACSRQVLLKHSRCCVLLQSASVVHWFVPGPLITLHAFSALQYVWVAGAEETEEREMELELEREEEEEVGRQEALHSLRESYSISQMEQGSRRRHNPVMGLQQAGPGGTEETEDDEDGREEEEDEGREESVCVLLEEDEREEEETEETEETDETEDDEEDRDEETEDCVTWQGAMEARAATSVAERTRP